MNTSTSSEYLQPALIGGVTMGVLSALPVVSAGNFCCCLWVVSGGLLAAYLLQQNRPSRISPGEGAIVGLLAGLIGAVVQQVLAIPIGLLVGPMERQLLQRLAEMSGSIPPGMRDVLNGADDGGAGRWIALLIFRAVAFFFVLTVGAMVSTVSGLIGAALFGRDSQPRDVSSS